MEGKSKEVFIDESALKGKFLKGTFWKFFERFLAQGVSLIVSIIIARLLVPDDYSVVSIVAIFFAFANVLISGGLNTALIQKKNADYEDYSTVLHISVIISLIIYVILFFTAPAIANLYHKEQLVPIIRIISISLPITAIKSIWCAYISAKMQFRKFFFATIGGTIISAVVGIVMALKGFGPWALVAQQLTNTAIDTLILIITTRIRIVPRINISKFKSLFKYGWKILVSSFLNTTYNEITPLVIGLRFNTTDLALYSKGKTYPQTVSSMTVNTLSSVLFPFLSKFQDNKSKILHYTRKYMQMASFIVFPMLLGLFAVSENFVHVILTDKWMGITFYMKVFCIACMFDIVAVGNCESIKAIGKSGVFLIMEIIKKTSYLILIVLFVLFSKDPHILVFSALACAIVQIIVNSIPNRFILGYRFLDQIKDLLPSLLASVAMCIAVKFVHTSGDSYGALELLKQIAVGIFIYVVLSLTFRNKALKDIKKVLFKNEKK